MNQMSNMPTPEADAAEDSIDLFELWQTIVEGKLIVLFSALVCFVFAVAVGFLMTPKYEAELLLAPAEDGKSAGVGGALAGQLGGLADIAGVSVGGKGGDKEAALAYLKSRKFIEHFIEEKGLLPVLFPKGWDSEAKKWRDPEKAPTLWQGYKYFNQIWTVDADKKTGLIKAKLLWKDRVEVADWANDLVRRANDNWRMRTIEETDKNLEYLQKELQKTSVVEVQQVIYRLIEGQVKSRMMANVREEYAFKVIDPAAPVNDDAFVQPKRPLMAAIGLMGGLAFGVMLVFARKALRMRRERLAGANPV